MNKSCTDSCKCDPCKCDPCACGKDVEDTGQCPKVGTGQCPKVGTGQCPKVGTGQCPCFFECRDKLKATIRYLNDTRVFLVACDKCPLAKGLVDQADALLKDFECINY